MVKDMNSERKSDNGRLLSRGRMVLLLAALAFCTVSNAQILRSGEPVPQGAVIYSLPQTSVKVDVKVRRTVFTAGPYAAYAQKYLGVNAKQSDSQEYSIEEVSISYDIESDPSVSIALNLGNSKNATANFLNFTENGLLVAPGYFTSSGAASFNPAAREAEWTKSVQAVSHLDKKTTKLYRSVTKEDGSVDRVAVPQTKIVEKSAEQKAEETAELIFKLRQKRIEILTGETDANYSGEALGAAMKEISRLEKQYVALFVGKTVTDFQSGSYVVVPNARNAKHTYVAFRISDTQGLVAADNVSGRPVYMDFSVTEGKIDGAVSEADILNSKGKIVYRTPVIATVKVIDGQKVLGQGRVPVYQFGKTHLIPMETAFGK